MQLSRDERRASSRASRPRQTAKDSAEEVLHPPGSTPRFATPAALQQAWADEQIVALPANERVTGLRADPRMGELAPRSARRRRSTEGCVPRRSPPRSTSAPRCARCPARRRSSSPRPCATTPTSSCSSRATARRPATTRCTPPAGRSTSRASYRSKAHALAFQFVLDRLQVLDAIAWAREPDAIHITAAPEGKALLPLLKRVQPGG